MSISMPNQSNRLAQPSDKDVRDIPPKNGNRLAGVDLLRGLAAYGVICIHAGIVDQQITASALALASFFGFVVPFFLITAFYFALHGSRPVSWKAWLTNRISRLLVPYAIWSFVYLFLHAIKLVLTHQADNLHTLFQDPVASLLLNGGGAVALYFLPLLFTGLLFIQVFGKQLQRLSSWILIAAMLSSGICLYLLLQSGNAYDLASSQAFRTVFPSINNLSPFRLVLAFTSHLLTCLPYIFAAQLVVRHSPRSKIKNPLLLFFGVVLLVIPFLWPGPDTPLVQPIRGAGVLLLALFLSGCISPNWVTNMLGTLSFGIYLVHQIVLEVIEVIVKQMHILLYPMNILIMIGVSTVAFLISLLCVGLANRGTLPLRKIFGLA